MDSNTNYSNQQNEDYEQLVEFYKQYQYTQQAYNDYYCNCPQNINNLHKIEKSNKLWYIIWLLFLAMLFLIGFSGIDSSNTDDAAFAGMWIFIVIIAGIISLVMYSKAENKNRQKLGDLILQQEQAKQYINEAYNNSNRIIPFIYAEPRIVYTLIQYMENRRADSIKEAINLYEQQKNFNVQMNQLHGIAQMSAINAAANVVNATSNVANTIHHW